MALDSPGVKAGPGELCTLELDMFQICLQMLFWVWVNTPDLEGCLSQAEAGGPGRSTKTPFWELKIKNPTMNFNPFTVNLKEHCDLELSGFVMDKKVDLGKSTSH